MYSETLKKLDLAKNESILYETLLREGELSTGKLASKSNINRRNVYDSLNRLQEKGLIFEIKYERENRYQAVDPMKLKEILKEKELALDKIMPDLTSMYHEQAHTDEVYTYKGIEGWKNHMNDVLRLGEDTYTIGGQGSWAQESIKDYSEYFLKEVEKKGITLHNLFDYRVKEENREILKIIKGKYRFLPKEYSTKSLVDVFGDYSIFYKDVTDGILDESSSLTVIRNQNIADTFRTWFKALWSISTD